MDELMKWYIKGKDFVFLVNILYYRYKGNECTECTAQTGSD